MSKLTTAFGFLIGLMLSTFSSVLLAADSHEGGGTATPANEFPYVNLTPSFVTNYDGGGRLRYLKVDVTVRTRRPGDMVLVKHMPYIRNQLVELFSAQLEEDLTSTMGKEKLRGEALERIRTSIDYLEGSGSENMLDLYFTSFVIQQ